jgi:hypothetical protein
MFQPEGTGLEVVKARIHVGCVRNLHTDHLLRQKAKVERLRRSLGGSFNRGAPGGAGIDHAGVVDIVLRIG